MSNAVNTMVNNLLKATYILLLLSTVMGCSLSNQDKEQSNDQVEIPLTAEIYTALKNSAGLKVVVIVDKGTSEEQEFVFENLSIDETTQTIAGDLTINNLSAEFHTFDLEYYIPHSDSAIGEVLIATGQTLQRNIGAGENQLDFFVAGDSNRGLAYPDDDGDGRSNLNEMNEDFNPKLANPIAPVATGDATDTNVLITWTPVDEVTSYAIYMATTAGVTIGNYLEKNGMRHEVTTTNFTHPSPLTNGTVYYFVITAKNERGESVESNELMLQPGTAPTGPHTPQGVTATPLDQGVELDWQTETGVTYTVYMRDTPNVGTVDPQDGTNWMEHAATPPWQHGSALTNGNTYYFIVVANDGTSSSSPSREVSATPLAPWQSTDIGPVPFNGSFSQNGDVFTVTGAGFNGPDIADNMHLVYQKVPGNREIIANVTSQTTTDNWAGVGLTIRETIDPGSVNVNLVDTLARGTRLHSRFTTGGYKHDVTSKNNVLPNWIKIVRLEDVFESYESSDGILWRMIGAVSVPMTQTDVFVGMTVSSNSSTDTNTGVFENVTIRDASHIDPPGSAVPVSVSSSTLPQNDNVDQGDKFYQVTGLTNGSKYSVEIYDQSDNAELLVYSDNFKSLVCGSFLDAERTDSCIASPSNGSLYIRTNGSNSISGSDYTVDVVPYSVDELTGALPFAETTLTNNKYKYYFVSGLVNGTDYRVTLTGLTADVDLYLYSDEFLSNPWKSTQVGTTDEGRVYTANSSGKVYIRVDASKTTAGGNFTIDVTAP